MAIGGSVDDGPFQDIVALDFPSLRWARVQSTYVTILNLQTFFLFIHGNQEAFLTGTVCDIYNGPTLTHANIPINEPSNVWSSATTLGATGPGCPEVATPAGYVPAQYQKTIAGAPSAEYFTRMDIKDSAGAEIKFTATDLDLCADTTFSKAYHPMT